MRRRPGPKHVTTVRISETASMMVHGDATPDELDLIAFTQLGRAVIDYDQKRRGYVTLRDGTTLPHHNPVGIAADGGNGDAQVLHRGWWIAPNGVIVQMVRETRWPDLWWMNYGHVKDGVLEAGCRECDGTGIFEGPDFEVTDVACRGRGTRPIGLLGQDFAGGISFDVGRPR